MGNVKNYNRRYGIRRYLVGVLPARLSDEMKSQTVLLLSLAVSGRVVLGADTLAALTASAAVGGPLLGAVLDRASKPGRVLAWATGIYAGGLGILMLSLGRVPVWMSLAVALAVGSLTSTISGGWSSRLPDVIVGDQVGQASALDAASYSITGLVGPAGAGLLVMALGGRPVAVLLSALLLATIPMAWQMPPVLREEDRFRGGVLRDAWSGFQSIVSSRPLRRATLVSAISYVGFGMVGVIAPLASRVDFGHAAFGGLLLSVVSIGALMAAALYAKRPTLVSPDLVVGITPLIMAAAFLLLMVSSRGVAVLAMLVLGIADGPQLAALFTVRHREAEDSTRSQVFMMGSSLKIATASLGTVLAGHLGTSSVRLALLVACAVQLAAVAVHFAMERRASV